MATHTNLTSLFTDIASAIRDKTSTSSSIVADAFPSAIRAIPTGITPSGTQYVSVSTPVNVESFAYAQVSDANLIGSNIISGVSILGVMGTREAFQPSGTLSINTNGTYDVRSYASADVNVSGGGGDAWALPNYIHTAKTQALDGYQNSIYYVGQLAFTMLSQIYELSLPNCKVVQYSAFYNCSSMYYVNLSQCKIVQSYAFVNCYKLKDINLTECIKTSDWAFGHCSSFLQEINLPQCRSIGSACFTGCFSLSNVSIPKAIQIGNGAFVYCSSLSNISLPCVYSVGASAFSSTGLTYISIPWVVRLYGYTFNSCQLSAVNCSRVEMTSMYDFAKNSCLQSVIFPHMTRIGTGCFQSDINMSYAEFGGVDYIDNYAFESCSKLSTVVFNTCYISSIYSNVFRYCDSLQSIYFPSQYASIVKSLSGWSLFSDKIVSLPHNSSSIYGYEYSRQSITSFPRDASTIYTVGAYAFARCSLSGTISLPECREIQAHAFDQCTPITEVDIPNCEFIASYAFLLCSWLSNANISNCQYIGDSAFENCVLSSLRLNSCKYIGSCAFKGAIKFSGSLTLSNNLQLGNYAFWGASSLRDIYLPDTQIIGDSCFYLCSSVAQVYAPNCCLIGDGAFWSCTSLSSVALNNCTIIGNNAFIYCSSMRELSLPNLINANSKAFCYITNLSKLHIPNCIDLRGDMFTGTNNIIFSEEDINQVMYNLVDNEIVDKTNSLVVGMHSNASGTRIASYTSIMPYGYVGTQLSTIILSACSQVGSYAFTSCNTSNVDLPVCHIVDYYAFCYAYSLQAINLSQCKYIGQGAFIDCGRLSNLYVPKCNYIGSSAFLGCSSLSWIKLYNSSIACVNGSPEFNANTSIYVPASLLAEYKTANIWSKFASQLFYSGYGITCNQLSVAAQPCGGRRTQTSGTANCVDDVFDESINGISHDINVQEQFISPVFPQNQASSTVIRTLSYTHLDKTVSYTVEQGPWGPEYDLENTTYSPLILSEDVPNPDPMIYDGPYTCTKSKTYTWFITKIKFIGYSKFKVYLRINNSYDDVIGASQLNPETIPTSQAQMKTYLKNQTTSGTTIADYTPVEYDISDPDTENFIYICIYRAYYTWPDTGYLLIQKTDGA